VNSENIVKLQTELQQLKSQKLLLDNQLAECQKQLGVIQAVQAQITELTKTIRHEEETLEYKRKEYYRWLFVCYMFDKTGIPSILIENSLCEVEQVANLILADISDSLRMEITTMRELSSTQAVQHCIVCGSIITSGNKCASCGYHVQGNKLKDELNLRIYDNGQEIMFNQDSGGGKVIVSLALRLALAKILAKKQKQCEFLILDEIFGSLDSVNRATVATLVFSALKDLLGFKQIFVITHTPVGEHNYREIVIKRHGDWSEIVYS
jgi:DNA repair exonuclease SbcCD ATPase subunit